MIEMLPLKYFLSFQTSLIHEISRALYILITIILDSATEQCWNV